MLAHRSKQRGIALAYVAIFITMLALVIGLAIDLGRAYAVRLELAKAVDAAALAAARVIPNGTAAARNEANKIFTLNFPNGHLGVKTVSAPTIVFGTVASGPNSGSHLITVSAAANLPTTFMAIGGKESIDVPATSQSTRRLVDMSFVIDHSGSLGGAYPQVQTAANRFVDFFDAVNDRMALVMYARDVVVADSIVASGRGFNRNNIKGHINQSTSNGNTAMPEALYRGWDELRRVPSDTQAGLRVIVLFTDGAPNTFPATFVRRTSNSSTGALSTTQFGQINTDDFPAVGQDGTNQPRTQGLFSANTACCSTLASQPDCITPTSNGSKCWPASNSSSTLYNQNRIPGIPLMPSVSTHASPQSTGIPTSFPLQTTGLSGQRTLLLETSGTTLVGYPYPSHPNNVSKAARNLVERIANEIRNDTSGAHPIHIYTLGLGNLLNSNQGVQPAESGSTVLRRIANDPASGSFNSSQPEGKYYFAGSATELNDAFQQIRDQIIRISE